MNPKYKEAQLRWYLKSSVKDRAETFVLLGNVCKKCGYDDPRALCIDHIDEDEDGHKRFNGIRGRLRAVQKAPEKFQTLCANCNLIKEVERRKRKR